MKHFRLLTVLAALLLAVTMLAAAGAETATDIALHQFVDLNDGTTMMVPDGWNEEITQQEGIYALTTYTPDRANSRNVIFV